MSITTPRSRDSLALIGLGAKLAYARKRAYAWWEGVRFDPMLERRAVLLRPRQACDLSILTERADFVAQVIWGPGRLAPGSPAWSMHLARTLMLEEKAKLGIFGAERGRAVRDLLEGTRWQVRGLARKNHRAYGISVEDYGRVSRRLNRPTLNGAMMLFDLHNDPEPSSTLKLMSEMMVPGAKAAVVEFTTARRNFRLKSAFAAPWDGVLRQPAEYERALGDVGLKVVSTVDDTNDYIPLIARGWSGWRYAWQILSDVPDRRQCAALQQLMKDHAAIWAERHDALRAGQMQVTRFMVEKV